MANRATVTYNGKTICTEDRDGSFAVTYNGSTIATVAAGQTKTLNCSGQVMKSNVVIGGKTLNCAKYKMATNVVVSVVSLFPSSPSSYNLIGTYTEGGVFTFTAPSTGYFQVEVQGASGSGGNYNNSWYAGGGGGGGGGCAISRVKLNKGDTITLYVSYTGYTNQAVINSSIESYATPMVTSGGVGGNAGVNSTDDGYVAYGGSGGAGGVASGGNYANYNGGAGSTGSVGSMINGGAGGSGGSPGYTGGRYGGAGGTSKSYIGSAAAPTEGSTGFIKIYAGNTNVA